MRSVTLLAMPPRKRDTARHLRRNATEAEALLWQALRARRLDGHKFRRQYPVASFMADFCCPSARLIVELDGGVHRARRSADAAREEILQHHGYRVLRIPNESVLHDLDAAQDCIRHALASPPAPLSIADRWRGGQGVRSAPTRYAGPAAGPIHDAGTRTGRYRWKHSSPLLSAMLRPGSKYGSYCANGSNTNSFGSFARLYAA